MFISVKNDTGAVPPLEYLPAAAGTYQAGQLLMVAAGLLTALTAAVSGMPQYVCMTSGKVEDRQPIAVTRVNAGTVYETVLGEDINEGMGTMLGVLSDGLRAGGTGCFELVSVEGMEEGCTVRGRFVPGTGGGMAAVCCGEPCEDAGECLTEGGETMKEDETE